MKSLLITILAFTIVSCVDEYSVKVKSGAIIKATDYTARNFKKGDTVCILSDDTYNWQITNTELMVDSSFEGVYRGRNYTLISRVGIIVK